MCGRFVSTSNPERIAEYFDATFDGTELAPNHNVAPTQDIYAVTEDPDGSKHVQTFHWGLIPVWAKKRKIGQRMIMARAETVAENGAFKGVFRKQRCLIPMDGFYEWRAGTSDGPVNKAGEPLKQPMYFFRDDGEPLAVAGLWSAWRDPADGGKGLWLHTASVVTTAANGTMEPVHDRMPVILPASVWSQWLDPENDDTDALKDLLVPAPDDLLALHPVSLDVNNVRNNGPELIEPDRVTPEGD